MLMDLDLVPFHHHRAVHVGAAGLADELPTRDAAMPPGELREGGVAHATLHVRHLHIRGRVTAVRFRWG